MKQVLQELNTGNTKLENVAACVGAHANQLLIRTGSSLVSVGTEKMLVDFGKANFIDKARLQPDKVKMVLNKVKTDGLGPTIETVKNKLDQPLPMGYCNVGRVLEVGTDVDGFSIGQRIASNGKHAEVVSVPKNLCAKIPDSVTDEQAAFTVMGAIALQGIRLVNPTLGETVVVTGLGLIGLITVQLLRASGCRVVGIDMDPAKLALAREFGAETVDLSKGEDPVKVAMAYSRDRGVDAVIITAATKSNEPVHQAAQMSRKRGRIVLVGVVGLELSRADFFEKELTFQVSCSYGPGRYDSSYEDKGNDYPFGYVRWTEQRNFEAVLDMLADGRLNVDPLISHRFSILEAKQAYEVVGGSEPSLGILLKYRDESEISDEELQTATIQLDSGSTRQAKASSVSLGFIGAGNYASSMLMPAFKDTSASFRTVSSATGVSGTHYGKKFGFSQSTTDTDSMFSDSALNTVVITTRHNSHARFTTSALTSGKHVFVEKPLALDREELGEIETAYRDNAPEKAPLLMVGFNRRFAPQVQKMKSLLGSVRSPKSFIMTVNAGDIPQDHWTQDMAVGGRRIIGEGCHFIDLLRHLAGSPIVSVQSAAIGDVQGVGLRDDKVVFTLTFADGSFGTVHYLANGHKSFPKERLEVFCDGKVLQLDNFRKLKGFGWDKFKSMNLTRQDKGQKACVAAFVDAIENGKGSPIPFEELMEVTRVSFDIMDQIYPK